MITIKFDTADVNGITWLVKSLKETDFGVFFTTDYSKMVKGGDHFPTVTTFRDYDSALAHYNNI